MIPFPTVAPRTTVTGNTTHPQEVNVMSALATQTLTPAQEATVDAIEAQFTQRIVNDARLGVGAPLDPDELAIDLLTGAQDPAVAQAVRERLGVGVAA